MIKIPHGKDRNLPVWIQENIPADLVSSTLFRFKVKLQAIDSVDPDTKKPKRKEIEVDLIPDLDLDYDILESQMSAIPAQYAFWAAVYSEVRLGVAVAERKLKARKAEVTKAIQKEAAEEGVRLNADTIKIIVEADVRLNEAELNYQHAQMQAGKLYNMLEALKMKSELARSLLGLKKQERDNS